MYIMAGVVEVVKRVFRPYQYTILLIVMFVLFLLVGIYGYNQYFKKKQTVFKDVANANRRNVEIIVYLFHVDWCPHCKTALPEWGSFKQQYDNKEINGYKVKCVDVDCTEEDSKVANYLNKYNVESFPTVKMVKNNDTITFDAKVTSKNLEHFVETVLHD